ncbi:MAG: Hsp33 family molecular chaperone HslO [Pseudomonadota bacterium]
MVFDLNTPADDLIQPFQIVNLGLSGRLVRLGESVNRVLCQHAYPEPVSVMLGELMALAAALGSGLKFDGRMTAETRGDGPIRLLAVDFMSDGRMRGYASFDRERIAEVESAGLESNNSVPHLLGSGVLVLTVDQGADMELYQGIVSLDGATLADSAHLYFQQSDQVDSAIKLAVARHDEGWRAGALTMQRLAELGPGDIPITSADREDDWRKAVVLLSTATGEELTDPGLDANTLLYRLFHEDGVRVYDRRAVRFGCTCSDDRAMAVLQSMPSSELEELVDDGVIDVTCQFCNRSQKFTLADVEAAASQRVEQQRDGL